MTIEALDASDGQNEDGKQKEDQEKSVHSENRHVTSPAFLLYSIKEKHKLEVL